MSVAVEFEAANAKYASTFTKGDLALPPQRCVKQIFMHFFPSNKRDKAHLDGHIRKVAVVACMDARLGELLV